MRQIIPLKKQSKREQKEYHAKKRGSWNGVNAVTRVVPNGKPFDTCRFLFHSPYRSENIVNSACENGRNMLFLTKNRRYQKVYLLIAPVLPFTIRYSRKRL